MSHKALFSAFPTKYIKMNLDFLVFIRFDSYNHQQKILITPMTRHDCTEELFQELKRRYTMHPARGYDCMIRSRDFHHPVATEEQRVLSLTRKRADEKSNYRVVDAVEPIIPRHSFFQYIYLITNKKRTYLPLFSINTFMSSAINLSAASRSLSLNASIALKYKEFPSRTISSSSALMSSARIM